MKEFCNLCLAEQANVLLIIWDGCLVSSLPEPTAIANIASPVKVILPLSVCYTSGLRHRHSGGGCHAGQSVRTFCGEKFHFRHGAWHPGTRFGSRATRCLV